jgi:formate hydrogenlyase subunit 3/multisubunit Na+/H+ antiporter MnhD subunit
MSGWAQVGYWIVAAALVGIPLALVFGLKWIIAQIAPWLMPAFFLTLAVSIFGLAPLALIHKTRAFSGPCLHSSAACSQ